ncbi:MAG: pirin family protein [Bacteroidota bacterium]
MDRKNFLKKAILGTAAAASTQALSAAESKPSTYDKLMKQVGFNHLPNQEMNTAKTVLHKADTRGHANHGWLDSHHSFSFANYYRPDRMHFGALRVLNDDRVAAGRGFGTHPHDNMEIISIPLEGDLEHQDSMGNTAVIRQGDVQVLSAGTGISHSEYNKNQDQEVRFLQIWLFPREKGVTPRYDQISIESEKTPNQWNQILSPYPDDEGVWIHQDAWFHLGEFEAGTGAAYELKKAGNGVYVFVLEGEVEVNGQVLDKRDGYGLWDLKGFDFTANKSSRVLLMEVPMNV